MFRSTFEVKILSIVKKRHLSDTFKEVFRHILHKKFSIDYIQSNFHS